MHDTFNYFFAIMKFLYTLALGGILAHHAMPSDDRDQGIRHWMGVFIGYEHLVPTQFNIKGTTETIARFWDHPERAVVPSIEDYHAPAAHNPDFKAYLLGGPKIDNFSIERDRDTGRAVEL